jgi:hypothetical protein
VIDRRRSWTRAPRAGQASSRPAWKLSLPAHVSGFGLEMTNLRLRLVIFESTWVKPYVRRDGTQVCGHWRHVRRPPRGRSPRREVVGPRREIVVSPTPRPFHPGAPARGLLAIASALLPPAHRERYAEEYLCELRDLAVSGASRPELLRYALRQLRLVIPLRVAVLSPHRKSAAP